MILVGDIGGTKTNIALFAAKNARRPELISESTFASAEYPGLEQIVAEFLSGAKPIAPLTGACFGIAGPIVDQRCEVSNLPWVIEARALQQAFSIPKVTLINDLEATAESVAALDPNELASLNPRVPLREPTGLEPGAVIAAGTGLGMALLVPQGGEWVPAASEGGHADYAPRNALEAELLAFLLKRHARVSIERVLSGPGLYTLYEFFSARPSAQPNAELAARIARDPANAPEHVSTAALEGQCPVCVQALDQFVATYGACAGNLGLIALSSGGLYLGGGIAPKILPKLQNGAFLSAFTHKGRLSGVLERMPVAAILNPKTALLGAARRALRELRPM